jgi:hypothetical protein
MAAGNAFAASRNIPSNEIGFGSMVFGTPGGQNLNQGFSLFSELEPGFFACGWLSFFPMIEPPLLVTA